ncbi:hypothetical protein MRX96_054025, partial [Rhipicephalus microplus]
MTRLAADPERVAKEAVSVDAAAAAEAQRDSSGSENMCTTSATLKRIREETGEQDKTSSTNNEEPPPKTPRARWSRLKPKTKNRSGKSTSRQDNGTRRRKA